MRNLLYTYALLATRILLKLNKSIESVGSIGKVPCAEFSEALQMPSYPLRFVKEVGHAQTFRLCRLS